MIFGVSEHLGISPLDQGAFSRFVREHPPMQQLLSDYEAGKVPDVDMLPSMTFLWHEYRKQ